MEWEIEVTDEFLSWFNALTWQEQKVTGAAIEQLGELGPHLAFPLSSGINGSRHPHMRELRVQYHGRPFRILYAFDPRRVAILLLGGDKTGDDRWYQRNVPIADALYDRYLRELTEEGLL